MRDNPSLQFHCKTCPYLLPITGKITRKTKLTLKSVGDPLGREHEEMGAKTQGTPSVQHKQYTLFFQRWLSVLRHVFLSRVPSLWS